MRPQQNRRMRGRGNNNNNNNRRSPNPLSRNYESNGPDVKIRGNAQHIAEKYATLARDAHASGDRVTAENYLQHAEHYNRIILAAQAQMPQPVMREEMDDDDADENTLDEINTNVAQNDEVVEPAGSGPQPLIEGTPAEVLLSEKETDASATKTARRTTKRRAPRARVEKPVLEVVNSNDSGEEVAPRLENGKSNDQAAEKVLNVVTLSSNETSKDAPVAKPRRGRPPKVVAEEV